MCTFMAVLRLSAWPVKTWTPFRPGGSVLYMGTSTQLPWSGGALVADVARTAPAAGLNTSRIPADGGRELAGRQRREAGQRAGSDTPRAWSRPATTRYPSLLGSKVVDCTVSPTLRNCATRSSYR